jgi:hypothetical protein
MFLDGFHEDGQFRTKHVVIPEFKTRGCVWRNYNDLV